MDIKKIFLCLFLILSVFSDARADRNFWNDAGNFLLIALPVSAYSVTFFKKDKNGTRELTKSLLFDTGITYSLKYLIKKRRPNGEDHSFPSGHTSIAFTCAGFIQKRYGWKNAFLFILAGIFTGISRIEAKEHYTEDVIAGAIIGWFSSYIFTTQFKSKSRIGFYFSPEFFYLSLKF